MKLIPCYEKIITEYTPPPTSKGKKIFIPRCPKFYQKEINYIQDRVGIKSLVAFLLQSALAFIGFDTEFKYNRPSVILRGKKKVYDIRSICPLLLSLTVCARTNDIYILYDFVIDLRKPELIKHLQQIFNLPVTFVGHNAKWELFCLWKLDIKVPLKIWDTFIHEKANYLGKYNKKYVVKNLTSEPVDQARAAELKQLNEQFSYSLTATCHRYGVPFAMKQEKERLQKSFLKHDFKQPFSEEQIKYSAEDSRAAASLYLHQVLSAVQQGILDNFLNTEMPWEITNAAMQWRGLLIDYEQKDKIIPLIKEAKYSLEEQLVKIGINNCRSHKQLKNYFMHEGLLKHFKKQGGYCFDKEQFKKLKHLHPSIEILSETRRASKLLSDQIHMPELICIDGRVHPEHIQLGTDTGRQTSKFPNILGLDKRLRPLIIPEQGYGIGEVDWCQKEIGIAAVIYDDPILLEMFNNGDVYTAMAKEYFKNQLPEGDSLLPDKDFKKKHPGKRDVMKTCSLGMIYGFTPYGLATELNVSYMKAQVIHKRFMDLFPSLRQNIAYLQKASAYRGYATTMSGLKRYRNSNEMANRWELNWLSNFPIQGSAAVIMKTAGNRLYKLYQQYDAHLLIAVHDSFVFEAPLAHLEKVAKFTEKVMCESVQQYFPKLKPKAEINISEPSCWNKDGNTDALHDWIQGIQEKATHPND